MKYLLDVNALLAAIIANHPQHALADAWLQKRQLAVCPLSELGFLRISTHPKTYNLSMSIARQALREFIAESQAEFLPADLPALKSSAAKTEQVTDNYLADLAARHNLKLATLDSKLVHPAVEVIK